MKIISHRLRRRAAQPSHVRASVDHSDSALLSIAIFYKSRIQRIKKNCTNHDVWIAEAMLSAGILSSGPHINCGFVQVSRAQWSSFGFQSIHQISLPWNNIAGSNGKAVKFFPNRLFRGSSRGIELGYLFELNRFVKKLRNS